MILAVLAVLGGLVMLVWSADRFVDGAARTASYFKVPPILIGMLAALVGWTVRAEHKAHAPAASATEEGATAPSLDDEAAAPIRPILFWLIIDLALLVISSRVLVWGAVEIAHGFGVSDLIIGLTIVAVGTSLPELASSVAAARKGEDDLALGNVIGSNLFNTLGVVGLAAAIQPMSVETQLLSRDIPVMCVLTLALFALGYNFRKSRPGRINRLEGCLLLAGYIGYTVWLIESTFIRGAA